MSVYYPQKSTVFIALSRPAMVVGVSIEYLFITLSLTLAMIILMDSLGYALVGLVIYGVGRIIFYYDHHLIVILFSRITPTGKCVSRLLGQAYYEVA